MSAVAEILIKGRVDSSLAQAAQVASTRLSASGIGAAKATSLATGASTKLAQATLNVDRAARAAGQSTGRLSSAANRTGAAFGRMAREAREAQNAVRKLDKTSKESVSLTDVATALGTGGALKKSFGASLNTEAAQVRLATAINATDKDAAVKAATASASAFSRRAPVNKGQVLDVNYALNSAGLQANVARAGAEAVTKVAKVTNGSAEQVAEIMATAYNNLGQTVAGPETEKMARIGDMMTKTQLKYQIRDFGQLGEGISYASATAASAKIPMNDMLVILGQLNTAGVSGSRAGTAFTAVFRSMTKAAKDLGFEIVRDNQGQLDYIATLENMNEALSSIDDIDQRNDKLQELFGDEGKAGVIPLLAALKQAKGDRAELAATIGLTDAEFARFVNARGGKIQTVINGIVEMGEAITDSMLPAVDMLAGPMIAATGYMTDLITQFPHLGQAIGITMATLSGLAALRVARSSLGLLSRGGAAAAPAGGVPVRVMNTGLGAALGGKDGFLGKAGGKLGRMGKMFGGKGNVALAALAYAPDIIDGISSGDGKKTGGAVGGLGGSLAGAAAGAAIGSVVPVIGTAIGGLIGGLLGGMGGDALGSWVGGMFDKTAPASAAAEKAQAPVTKTTTNTFNIATQPGQDTARIARELAREMDQRSRGALYDGE